MQSDAATVYTTDLLATSRVWHPTHNHQWNRLHHHEHITTSGTDDIIMYTQPTTSGTDDIMYTQPPVEPITSSWTHNHLWNRLHHHEHTTTSGTDDIIMYTQPIMEPITLSWTHNHQCNRLNHHENNHQWNRLHHHEHNHQWNRLHHHEHTTTSGTDDIIMNTQPPVEPIKSSWK